MNKWNIPDWLEKEVLQRDKICVYCGVEFSIKNKSCKKTPTWEHIVNDIKIITRENIARCCFSCNASKGAKELSIWLDSPYCKNKDINKDNVAKVVKEALVSPPQCDKTNA